MRIHYLQHVPFEGPGSIEIWARKQGFLISSTPVFDTIEFPDPDLFDCLVIMGGPMSVHDEDQYSWLVPEKTFIKRILESNKPIMGVCLGAQLIADVLDAEVYPGPEKEIGWFPLRMNTESKHALIKAFPNDVSVFHWHGETFDLPEHSVLLASSDGCPRQGFLYKDRVIGFQFHLESTPESVQALIDHCSGELTDAPYIQTPEQMLADRDRFTTVNFIMDSVLDYLKSFVG